VSVKYKTKNTKTDCNDVFLVTINQIRAKTISSRNLRLTAKRLYIVWLSGVLVWPLRKMKRVIKEITENITDNIIISLNIIPVVSVIIRTYPDPRISKFSIKSKKIYLRRGFNKAGYLIKSFTAVYIAAKTPRRERIIVKTGFSVPVSLSSLIPPQVVTRIIPIIWNAIPEYLAKSWIPLFPCLFWFFFFVDWCSSISVIFTHFTVSRENSSRLYWKFRGGYISEYFWGCF